MPEVTTAQHLAETILPANIAGLTFGTNLFYNKLLAKKAIGVATVAVYDTGGGDPAKNADVTNHAPNVEVLVYGPPTKYAIAQTMAQAIHDYIVDSFGSQVVGATTYVGAYGAGDVMFLRYDENDRPIFSANFRFDKHE